MVAPSASTRDLPAQSVFHKSSCDHIATRALSKPGFGLGRRKIHDDSTLSPRSPRSTQHIHPSSTHPLCVQRNTPQDSRHQTSLHLGESHLQITKSTRLIGRGAPPGFPYRAVPSLTDWPTCMCSIADSIFEFVFTSCDSLPSQREQGRPVGLGLVLLGSARFYACSGH